MPIDYKEIAKDYPKRGVSENGLLEYEIRFTLCVMGYRLNHYWKRVNEEEWHTHEKLYVYIDSTGQYSTGYESVRWKDNALWLQPYKDFDDLDYPEVEFDVTNNKIIDEE